MRKVKRILSLIAAIAVMMGTLTLTFASASAVATDSDYGILRSNDFEVDTA